MKIVVYNIIGEGTGRWEIDLLLNFLKETDNEIITYDANQEEYFFYKTKHFQMYQGVLNYAESIKADLLFIYSLPFPEFLFSELKTRLFFYKPKIVFSFLARGLDRSPARANMFRMLIDLPQIKRAIMVSTAGKYMELPQNWKKLDVNKNKFVVALETMYKYSSKDFLVNKQESKEMFKVQNKEFIVLFFGELFFSKGLDTLIEAVKYTDDDIHFLIQCHYENLDHNLDVEAIQECKRITFFNSFISDENVKNLLKSCDVLVMPYRKSYKYSCTGVIRLGILANKPVIVPDFSPFTEMVNLFKVGEIFEPENSRSLGKTISMVKKNYQYYVEEVEKTKYKELISPWEKTWRNFTSLICS